MVVLESKPQMQRTALLILLLCAVTLAGQSSDLCGNKRPPRRVEDYEPVYNWWLDQDVRWIITPEERSAFKRLQNDEERNQFIEQFWLSRDPTPDTVENEFKDEQYRRMMYANEHFGTSIPGWRTDRGRIYVTEGPPDEVANDTARSSDEKRTTSEYPKQTWHYAKLPSSQKPADLQFVDQWLNGEYRYIMSREEKDALLNVPIPDHSGLAKEREQHGLVQYVGGVMAPEVKFKDLEDILVHKIKYTMVPFAVTTSSFRVTDLTDWVAVKLEINGKDLQWKIDGDNRKAKVRYYARVISLTGRIIAQFEDEMDVVGRAGDENKSYSFGKALPLSGGLYRLDVAMQDVIGDTMGTTSTEMHVGVSSHISSIVLSAAASDPVFQPTQQQTTFSAGTSIHAYAQLYDLAVDPKTNVPDASVNFELFSAMGKKPVSVAHYTDATRTRNERGEQISLTKEFPAPPPGNYDLVLRVVDNISKQQGCTQTQFTVK